MTKKTIIKEYKKLLKVGRGRIKGTDDNDLEEHAELDKLLPLNYFVYTYYSTNVLDDTYSIEFVVLADYMNIILEEFKKKKFWYCAKNYKTNEFVKHFDEKLNDKVKKMTMNIGKEDLYRFLPKSEKNPYGWEIYKENGDILTMRKDHKIHFLESEYINDIDSMYNDSSNYFLQMSFISDLRNSIDIDLLSENIAVITVEDPEINRNTLYEELYKIFKENINFGNVDKYRKGTSNRSRKGTSNRSRKGSSNGSSNGSHKKGKL